MHIVGIDLSGPRNIADTCVAVFTPLDSELRFGHSLERADDRAIYGLIDALGKLDDVVVGIDAPLSYNPGGGDRPSDRELRLQVQRRGRVGVMPPTLIRMVYLTLRGIALTRMLESLRPQLAVRIVEVHPGAAMLLRGAPPLDVAAFKKSEAARLRLVDWLRTAALTGLPRMQPLSDHFVAACAASLAAWQWAMGRPVWCAEAQPPEHPYDFAC